MPTDTLKTSICDALAAFIRQRPGMDPREYGDDSTYRSESRRVSLHKRDAETLLAAVRWRDSISGADIIEAARGGRLTIEANPESFRPVSETSASFGGMGRPIVRIDYCAGQDYRTEYRAGVCRVLSSALWNWQREAMPAPTGKVKRTAGVAPFTYETEHDNIEGKSPGDWLRAKFRREFGSSLARRWFN